MSVAVTNYTPQTTLTGWDNLQTEINIFLNLKRSLSAVWQEYQGLGLLGGMAHAADLPRELLMLIPGAILPQNLVRYFSTFAMLVLGPLGVFYFVKFLGKHHSKQPSYLALISFVAGLAYLFNLATIQYFYNPYESFVWFYGFFPWLILASVNYLNNPRKKNLLIFCLTAFMAASAFYVQTLFIVFVMTISLFVLENLLNKRKKGMKRSVMYLAALFAVNAFWLLPVIYFIFTNSFVVTSAKINYLSTPETQLMNQGAQKITDVALLKGFWFEYQDWGKDSFEYLYKNWRNHIDKPFISAIGYVFFSFAVFGYLYNLRSKNIFRYSLFAGFLLSLFFLMGGKLPLPLFDQIFRSVFTKWSVVMAFFLSVGMAYFLFIFDGLSRFIKKTFVPILILLVIVGLFTFGGLVYKGEMVSQSMRVEVPSVYADMYHFFKGEPKDKRIAFFPIHNFWGWNFYDWGYRGSGFLWYGIEQPILDRAFDVWSANNETFYEESVRAINAADTEGFLNITHKYNVSYALIDKSVISPGKDKDLFKYDVLETMLVNIGAKKVFSKDFLTVYEIPQKENNQGFLAVNDTLRNVQADTSYAREDPIYRDLGYYTNLSSGNGVLYPFTSLYKEKITGEKYTDLGNGLTQFTMQKEINDLVEGEAYSIYFPGIQTKNYLFNAEVSYKNRQITVQLLKPFTLQWNNTEVNLGEFEPIKLTTRANYDKVILAISGETVTVANGGSAYLSNIELTIGQAVNVDVYDGSKKDEVFGLQSQFSETAVNKCWEREGGKGYLAYSYLLGVLNIETQDAAGCQPIKIGTFSSPKSLVTINLPYRSENNSRPHFCFLEEGAADCLHDDIFYHSYPSNSWSTVSRTVILRPGITYWMVLGARPSDTADEKWLIHYKVPQVYSYPLVASFSFSSNIWKDYTTAKTISVEAKQNNVLELLLNLQGAAVDFAKGGRNEAKNCDIFNRGFVTKQVSGQNVEYTASQMGAACDYTTIPQADSQHEYLLRFQGENSQSRNLKFYLYNKATGNNDLENYLDKGSFDNTIPVLSWKNYKEDEYVLNLETRSLGGEVSKNLISQVEVYPVTLEPLAQIQVIKDGSGVLKNQNQDHQVTYKKFGTWLYDVEVNGDSENSILILHQGFNNGWISIPNLEHVEVNSWENGWKLQCQPDNSQCGAVLIYWPQMLEYTGLLLASAPLALMVVDKAKRRQ